MSPDSRWRAVLYVLCLLLIAGCQEQRGQRPPWTPMFGDLTMPVTITIEPWEQSSKYQKLYRKEPYEIKLRIPKNYLGNPFSGGGGKQLRIDIDAGLKEDGSDELEPQKAIFYIPKELNEATRQRAVTKLKNGVAILVNDSLYHDGEYYKKSDTLFINNKYGLDGYLDGTSNKNRYMKKTPTGWKQMEGGREHYFNSEGSTYPSVYLDCGREGDPIAGCTISMVHQNIPIKYFIRRSELYRWQQFDMAVRKLLDQFIVIDKKEIHHVR